jgi:hypothetical protein
MIARVKKSLVVIIFVLISCGFLSVSFMMYRGGSSQDSEPEYASAHRYRDRDRIVGIRSEPLEFGVLVGGPGIRQITLTPEGNVYSSGEILNQSRSSYVGRANSRYLAGRGNQASRGRLRFSVKSPSVGKYVLVKFLPGELDSGVNLGSLDIRVGRETRGVERVKTYQVANELLFRIVESPSLRYSKHREVNVDVYYGGLLSLSEHVSGQVTASMMVDISVVKRRNLFW